MAIAHATTAKEARRAIRACVDGLAHMFFDTRPAPELVAEIAHSVSNAIRLRLEDVRTLTKQE